jgi:predicted nucleic acid-binding protein
MYLVDTNVWLEQLLDQEHAQEVSKFFDEVSSESLFITDFSFHSICLVLTRFGRHQSAVDFVNDLFVQNRVGLLTVNPKEIQPLVDVMINFSLDFDDAYQYLIAERQKLIIVTFDNDFRRTPRRGRTPAQIIATL